MISVDPTLLSVLFLKLKARKLPYLWGGKADPLDCDSSALSGLDCSGWTQYGFAKSTGPMVEVPEGSVDQHDWCDEHGLKRLAHYSDVQYAAKDPSRLFWCFIEPHGDKPGHTFFVRAGMTMESHGGVGIDSRPWDCSALRGAVAAYEVPTK
jgi:hypothetical protein